MSADIGHAYMALKAAANTQTVTGVSFAPPHAQDIKDDSVHIKVSQSVTQREDMGGWRKARQGVCESSRRMSISYLWVCGVHACSCQCVDCWGPRWAASRCACCPHPSHSNSPL